MSDFSSVFFWWLTLLIIGGIAYPITSLIFNRFIDKGYIFAKVVGVLLSSYAVWLLASFHLLPFTKLTILIVLIAWMILNLWFFGKVPNGKKMLPWKWIILEELFFLIALSFWSYVRGTEPSISGLEKFMDFGFVNSILRSDYFPPLDMWLAKSPDYAGGYFINYYYYGHYYTAFLTKLSGIDSAITYNLSIATLFAFTFTLSFSLGSNLLYLFKLVKNPKHEIRNPKQIPITKIQNSKQFETLEHSSFDIVSNFDIRISKLQLIAVGLLAAFLVSLGGNLHTIYVFTNPYPNHEEPIPPWKLELGFHPDRYWYPNATRFIPNTIHEFPIYSFVVSDLHGHVADIPFVLLTLAVFLSLIIRDSHLSHLGNLGHLSNIQKFSHEFEDRTGVPLLHIILIGLFLGIMFMTNAWDGIIYMALAGLIFLYRNLQKENSFLHALYKTFSASLFLVFIYLLTDLPFTLNFRPFVSEVGVLCAPSFLTGKQIGPLLFEADHCQRSPIYMLVILWGFFYYCVLGYLLIAILPKIKTFATNHIPKSERLNFRINKKNRLFGLIRAPIRFIRELSPVDVFVLLLILLSTLLLTFPEFFYMKDIYPAHYRANTMFKLGYQAFMMLGIVSAYIIFRIRHSVVRGFKLSIFYFLFSIFFFLIAIYPYFAVSSYYDRLRNYKGLYGLNWLATQYPDDYQAILWLQKNVSCPASLFIGTANNGCSNQPVIVEANGESYTEYARVSANTGLPTIVGWPVHEWLWRGSYDEAGKRIPEVQTVYESQDLDLTKQILKKYKAEYIFLGNLEREKYPDLYEEKFDNLGDVVFESGETKIYKISI